MKILGVYERSDPVPSIGRETPIWQCTRRSWVQPLQHHPVEQTRKVSKSILESHHRRGG